MDIYSTRERIRKENINFMNLPLRVTFYARVSTDFNVQLNLLDNQITYYTDFIRKNPNWEYVDGYVDEGISGVSTAKRGRFNEMIEDAKAGMFDLIVTKEVSRFARNTLDSIRFTRELLASGVAVYFQNDNINTLDEDSELRLTIMSSMAQDESRKISNRVRFGHQQAIKKGTVLGTNNMYGYIKKDGKLMIDETQADFVRELFEMYATGEFSMKQMEKHFYQKGIRNSKGKMLSHSTMSNIIRNPKYKGYYAGNKVRITDLFTKKQKFLPEEEWVMYKDETGETVPAIVSEELWDKANEVLYMRSQDVITAQHKTVHQNLLTGKLICAHCGMPYYRKDAVSKGGEKISKWVCSGKIKNGASSCPSRAIYESEIKPIIEDIFKSGQQHIEELSACVLKLVSEVLDTNENKDELNRLNQELITRQKMKAKLLQYNADGRMNDSEFIRMTADCDNEIKDIEKKINALNKTSKTEREMKKELAEIKTILKAAEKHIDGEEIDRAFVDRYISDITVYPDEKITRFEIHLKAGTTVTKTLQNLTSRAGSNSKKMMITLLVIVLCVAIIIGIVVLTGNGYSDLPGPADSENLAATQLESIEDSKGKSSVQKAVDSDTDTAWKSSKATDYFVLTFREEQTFNTIILREKGWNIKKFSLSYYVDTPGNEHWERFYEQDAINDYRYCAFDPVTAKQIKFEVLAADSIFRIREIEVYNIEQKEINKFRVSDYLITSLLVGDEIYNPESDKYYSPEYCDVINQIHVIAAAKWNDAGELLISDGVSSDELKSSVQRLKNYYAQQNKEVEIFATVFFNACNPDVVLTENKDAVIKNTVDFLLEYGFDGVSYDWEYPNKQQWLYFSEHLVSLKNELSKYNFKLSCAVSSWNFYMSKDAIACLDQIEVMAYDLFDENGNHSSFGSGAVQPVQYFLDKGFKPEQINLGLPFYARPYDGGGIWIDFDDPDYTPYDRFQNLSDGMWFTGTQLTMDKTAYAIENNLGGMMIFTAVMDVPYNNDLSLLKSLKTTVDTRAEIKNDVKGE